MNLIMISLIDLISNILQYNPNKRLTIQELLNHKSFLNINILGL